MDRRVLVAGLVTLLGCTQSRTGVVVTVQGGAVSVDELRVTATIDSLAPQTFPVPAVSRALSLPTTFFAELPDHDETVSFSVVAFDNGVEIAEGSAGPLAVKTHEAARATVVLGTDADAGSDGPRIACGSVTTLCKSGDLFCDGFETTSASDPFPEWSGAVTSGYAVDAKFAYPGTLIEDTTTRSCNGGHAMHAVTMGTDEQAFVSKEDLVIPSTVYMRELVYIPSTPGLTGLTMLLGLGDSSAKAYFQLGWVPADQNFIFRPNFVGGSTLTFHGDLPVDRWFCLTSEVVLSPTSGQLTIAIDGQPAVSAGPIVTEPTGFTYDTFTAGVVAADTAGEAYFDDVALSGSALACP